MLPNRIKISKSATSKLTYLKSKTGLTPNVLARFAIMLAINEGSNLNNSGVSDHEGQELNQSVLFGEHIEIYEAAINQYINENDLNPEDISNIIVSMIEIGTFKMGHLRSIEDIATLIEII